MSTCVKRHNCESQSPHFKGGTFSVGEIQFLHEISKGNSRSTAWPPTLEHNGGSGFEASSGTANPSCILAIWKNEQSWEHWDVRKLGTQNSRARFIHAVGGSFEFVWKMDPFIILTPSVPRSHLHATSSCAPQLWDFWTHACTRPSNKDNLGGENLSSWKRRTISNGFGDSFEGTTSQIPYKKSKTQISRAELRNQREDGWERIR